MKSKKATVAQIVENLQVGGLERMVLNLCRRLNTQRYHAVIYCLGNGGVLVEEAEACGIVVTLLKKKQGLDYSLAFKLSKALRRDGAEILHCHNYGPLIYGSLAAPLSGIKGTVYTSHGMKTSQESYRGMFFRIGKVGRIVTVSENARHLMIERGRIWPGRVITIANGIDTDDYSLSIDTKAKKNAIGLDPDVPVLGIVARLSPEKDHQTLFEAFAAFGRECIDVHLLVIGGGDLLAVLRNAAGRLGIESRVHFLGYRKDVAELLAVFDCFVLSSRSEGLSVTLLEAMAAGLPVVATDVGGNREVVRHEETGFLVPAGDPQQLAEALRRIFSDRKLARQMGENGRRRVQEHFSLDKMVDGYERIYDEILQGN